MSFRRRSSSKPSSSRGCNKVRITNRLDVAKIKSWVDFASRNNSNDEDEIGFPILNKKEESKESVYVECERMKKRHVKSLHKQSLKSKCYLNLDNSLMELCQNWTNKTKS